MDFRAYKKTMTDLRLERFWLHIVVCVEAALIAILAITAMNKETVVTITPWTLSSEAQVMQKDASRSYKEAWALAIVQLVGNVQPSTVDFVSERLKPLLDPKIYHSTLDAVHANAQMLRDDRISIRFEPREVIYEKSTDKVFVYGYSFMRSGTSMEKEDRSRRTYEIQLNIANYAPMLTYINTYEGEPRTRDALERQASIEKRTEERERRQAERLGIRYRPNDKTDKE